MLALILVGRSGTAIASEIGGMRVNRETDGLASCGINLDYFLVLPRIVGVTIASALLALTKLMVVDAGFCEANLQLLFTLLQNR